MKKLFIALTVLALFTAYAFADHLDYEATFSDVDEEHDNFVAIEYLVTIGTLEGYDDGTFLPEQGINRAELMKILVAGQGLNPDEDQFSNCFDDVTNDWYARYVCYAYENDWVEGYPDGLFRPANNVNKVEAVKMLINALGLSEELPDTVSSDLFDDTDNSQWYAPYLWVAKTKNLLEEESGNFEPDGDMDRGGVAEQIFRTLVVQGRDIEEYSEEERDEFLIEADLEELIGAVEQDEGPADLEQDMESGNYFFEGETIYAVPGQTVILTFVEDNGTHTFNIDELGVAESISEGKKITFVAPDETGTYEYYCSVGNHRALGMEGQLIVAEE